MFVEFKHAKLSNTEYLINKGQINMSGIEHFELACGNNPTRILFYFFDENRYIERWFETKEKCKAAYNKLCEKYVTII